MSQNDVYLSEAEIAELEVALTNCFENKEEQHCTKVLIDDKIFLFGIVYISEVQETKESNTNE